MTTFKKKITKLAKRLRRDGYVNNFVTSFATAKALLNHDVDKYIRLNISIKFYYDTQLNDWDHLYDTINGKIVDSQLFKDL